MSQDWSTNFFDGSHVWSTDMQNMENAFATLRSMFSGATSPANPVDGAPWKDTTKKVLKVYNGASWDGLMHGDTSQKLWVYRNSAMDGWAIDATVSDKVLAFKGGSTYLTGGTSAGTWTISGVGDHTHEGGSYALTVANLPAHDHQERAMRQSPDQVVSLYERTGGAEDSYTINADDIDHSLSGPGDPLTTAETGGGTSHAHGTTSVNDSAPHDGSWRPAANVGTLQYLDL